MEQINNHAKAKFIFIFIMFTIISFYPYEFYSTYFLFLPETKYIKIIFFLIPIFLISLFSIRKHFSFKVKLLIFIQFFGYCLVYTYHGNYSMIISQLLQTILFYLILQLLESHLGIVLFLRKYNRWILLMSILGVITWSLCQYGGLQPFYFVPDKAEEGRFINNYIINFSSSYSIGENMRYAGFFDEPGAMGYWGMYALITNHLFIKDKYLETPLIICLLFTFSVGFYLQLVFYIILFKVCSKNFIKGLIYCITLSALIVLVKNFENTSLDSIYQITYARIENTLNEGKTNSNYLSVDNRAKYSENALKEFKENPLFGTSRTDIECGNNIYEPLALYGIVGSSFILFPFIWLLFSAIKKSDIEMLKSMIIILIGFVHRPFHNNLLYFIVLFSIIILYNKRFRYSLSV